MLADVARVRNAIAELGRSPEYDLQFISEMFANVTHIDDVSYVRYSTPKTNPIWGEFARWTYQPAPYESFRTRVQVRYAEHLLDTPDWLRFVICKELCHALEVTNGKHDVSERAIDKLVGEFSILSHQGGFDDMSLPFRTELLAEVCALEILCPRAARAQIIANSGAPDENACIAIATMYGVPLSLLTVGFTPNYMSMVEDLIP